MPKSEKIFRIAWDGDGVLIDSHQPVLNAANIRLSHILNREIQLTKSDLNSWDALYRLALNLIGDEKIASEIIQYWYTPEVLQLSPPNLATIEVFNRCQKLSNTTQCIITTRPPECRQATQDSLGLHLHNFNWLRDLHIRPKSSNLKGEDFKIHDLRRNDITLMSEDNTDTISRIQTELPQCHLNYFSQPWNSTDQDLSRSKLRVAFDDTEAIYQRILEIRDNYLST